MKYELLQREDEEEQSQGLASYGEWNYEGPNYEHYGREWDGYWHAPIMKKEEDKEPMFKVVESPRSKKERPRMEKNRKRKGRRPNQQHGN